MENQVRDNYETIKMNCYKEYQKNKALLSLSFEDRKEFLNFMCECCNQYYYLKNTHLTSFTSWEDLEEYAKDNGLYIYFDDELADINYGHLCCTIFNNNGIFTLHKKCEIYDDNIIGLLYNNFNMETFEFED